MSSARQLQRLIAGACFALGIVLGGDALAAIAFVGASQSTAPLWYMGRGAAVSGAATVTPGMPASIQRGDVVLCVVTTHDTVTPTTSTVGWSTLYSLTNGTAERAAAFYRIVSSSADTGPTITHAGGNSIVSRCVAYRGVDQLAPFDSASPYYVAARTASATTATSGATQLTNASANAQMLFIDHFANNPAAPSISTTGGLAWTNRFWSGTGTGNNSGVGIWDASKAAAGAFGPVVATAASAAENHGVLIALKPAGNTIVIAAPAGTAAGHVMIAAVAEGPSATTITGVPSGWTQIGTTQIQGSGNTTRLSTYYKVATIADAGAEYTWTFSGTISYGAVGGILTFSGVETSAPVDVQAGATTASSTSHAAPSVTTTQANDMLVTVHEFASSRTWTPPAGMTEAVDVATGSAVGTPLGTAGMAMEMNYLLLGAMPGITGAKSATASASADTGATQTVALKPSIPLTCFNDAFTAADGSAPNTANWSVGNQNVASAFGNPKIYGNRLRLTDASTQAATWATLQRIFPAANNRVVVSFQHFAYNGSMGADGIAVILSDGAVAPQAGAFGGSMGYAPKDAAAGGDQTHPGFAGGWIGVALDEFGNFSADTEGRTSTGLPAAPGARADAVAIRGSGSGYAGYGYLAGTAAGQVIDNAGSAVAAPGYCYQITVDHSDGIHAMTSVARDTTCSGAYTDMIAPFDAVALFGQSSVPTNWYVSLTGSTGASTNIHEIDNLQICATTLQAIALDHVRILHDGAGITCTPETVTIKACANAGCSALYLGSVTVDLSNIAGATWSSDPVTFSGGQTTVTLSKPGAGTVTLGGTITAPAATTTTALCYNGATQTCSLVFSNSTSCAFDVVETTKLPGTPIYTKLAGTSFSLDIMSVTGGAVNSGYVGTVNVDLVDPTAASGNCADSNAGLSGTTVTPTPPYTFIAGNAGRKTFSFTYPYAASNVKVRVRDTSTGQIACSNDNFAIRPQQFSLSTTTAGLTAYTSNSFAAGSNFNITANPGVTQGYTGAPSIDWTKVVDHNNSATLSASLLTGSFAPVAAPGGGSLSSSFQYLDVGTLTINADGVHDSGFTAVDSAKGECIPGSTSNTLTAGQYGCNVGSTALGPLGRFRPAQYRVTATLVGSCGTTPNDFTYMDQPDLNVAFSITALDQAGTTPLSRYTNGYQVGGVSKLATVALTGESGGSAVDKFSQPLLGRLSPAFPASGAQWTGGVFDAGSATTFVRTTGNATCTATGGATTCPDGPYDSLRLKLVLTDPDSVKVTSLNGIAYVQANATDPVYSATTRIRFGRLRMLNAYGSERLGVRVPVRAEYWNGGGWSLNDLDNCTQIDDVGASLADGNYTGGLAAVSVCAAADWNAATQTCTNAAAVPLSITAGVATIPIGAPLVAGGVDLALNLGSSTDASCITWSPAAPATTGAALPWLRTAWCGSAYTRDPNARVMLGSPKAGHIYLRERY